MALTDITIPTPLRLALSLCFELNHIFPARAKTVIPIIRMDQVNSGFLSSPNKDKKVSGRKINKRAEKPKTELPALRMDEIFIQETSLT